MKHCRGDGTQLLPDRGHLTIAYNCRMSDQIGNLLVCCSDRKGIVAALAQVIYGHGANIMDANQHTDTEAGQFFQRIRFDLADLTTDRVALENGIREVAERFQMSLRICYDGAPKRMAVFVSKLDHCLYDLLLRHRAGELGCEIVLIISNHPDAAPIAEQFGIPYHVFEITEETRADQEAKELELLKDHEVDLVVLARYMQILLAEFVERYSARIINIHHSFLPAFAGASPYHQARTRGVKLIGATSHYVTADLDEGPIIEQDVVRCTHRDSVSDLVRKGRDLEKVVLARSVRWHLEDRILVYDGKTVVFD